ncbi:hypothetical protein TRAPUB_5445 [Trametes pubescens]|uniref:Uncharacterized protein n=1 Tax=Trametes pubescens TaxID=154538 RepID=A0A1M2V8F7_TRAPU|nr:hypothetical protein TRAPUB_5445 [Trametes pubescens]
MARMRIRYPNMVLGPVFESLDPHSPMLKQESANSRKRARNRQAAAVAAAAVAAVSPSNPYPVSWSTAARQASPPSSSPGATTDLEDGVRGGDPGIRESRYT